MCVPEFDMKPLNGNAQAQRDDKRQNIYIGLCFGGAQRQKICLCTFWFDVNSCVCVYVEIFFYLDEYIDYCFPIDDLPLNCATQILT